MFRSIFRFLKFWFDFVVYYFCYACAFFTCLYYYLDLYEERLGAFPDRELFFVHLTGLFVLLPLPFVFMFFVFWYDFRHQ